MSSGRGASIKVRHGKYGDKSIQDRSDEYNDYSCVVESFKLCLVLVLIKLQVSQHQEQNSIRHL